MILAVTLATVPIAIAVAVEMLGIGAVEQQGHAVVFLLLVVLLQFGEHGTLQQAGTHHEEGEAGLAAPAVPPFPRLPPAIKQNAGSVQRGDKNILKQIGMCTSPNT